MCRGGHRIYNLRDGVLSQLPLVWDVAFVRFDNGRITKHQFCELIDII